MIENDFFYTIINHSKEAYCAFDKNGKICFANTVIRKETEYGDEIEGVTADEIYPELVAISNGEIRWRVNSEDGKDIMTSAYRKNKTCYPVVAHVISGNVPGIAGIIIAYDYSEQKAAINRSKEAIEEMEYGIRMRTEFMANVTHELRTPVNGMKGMAENLLDTHLSASQQETVEIIIRNCNNMSKIINDILDFSKIESGKMSIERQKFNFRQSLDNLMTFHLNKIHEKGLKLIANIAPDVPTYIVGDEVRIGQIINNLISNAVKFTSVGYIALEVNVNQKTATQTELFVMVIDTGIGISDEERSRLFQSFQQADGSITRRFGGTGLGLSISKQLVELMGGQIRVESEKGKGSTFSFTIKVDNATLEEGEQEYAGPQGRYEYNRSMDSDAVSYRILEEDEEVLDADDNLQTAKESLEKMKICVELGTWEKAEEFAGVVKSMMPEDKQELKRLAFRLELCVRKEDYDKSVELMAELEGKLNEM